MDRLDLLEEISNAIPLEIKQKKHFDTSSSLSNVSQEFKNRHKEINLSIKRGHLHFLIGLPRSGKSTWATNWMRNKLPRQENDILFPRAVICADNIRLAVTGQRYNSWAEPTVHIVKDYAIEALLSRGHDVLVDGTHTTNNSIKRNLQIDPNASYTLINTPTELCKERAKISGQEDLLPAIDRMAEQLKRLLDTGLSQIFQKLQDEVRESNAKRSI